MTQVKVRTFRPISKELIGVAIDDIVYRMSKREKRLQKLRQNYKNVSFEDLQTVLEDFGFELLRSSGSHRTFKVTISGVSKQIVVPYRRPVKPIYVTQALELIDRIIASQEEQTEDGNDD